MKVTLFASTDVGQVRDHNEDNFAVCKDLDNKIWSFKKGEQVDLSAKGVVLVVADGMGGTNAGEVASDIAQKQIKEQFDSLENIPDKDKEKLKFIENAILAAHQKIVNHQEFNPSTAGMGTTIVVAWIINEKLYVGWVGDSRCYIFKKSQAMVPFTDDHSLVWGLVKEGKLTSEEARI
ncbi:MAG: protein phosphatase 2C domain-containing protein, partial [Cyclobacteriaceae bacterium]|nr:protein phosphatase 2C domain-containing protein [Cyclobacteriaceae bacterium]